MGYYTCFKFSVYSYGESGATNTRIVQAIRNLYCSDSRKFYPLIEHELSGSLGRLSSFEQHAELQGQAPLVLEPLGDIKWHENDADMLELSKSIPGVTFKLHGVGDEMDDVWDSYYLNRKMCTYSKSAGGLRLFDPKDLR